MSSEPTVFQAESTFRLRVVVCYPSGGPRDISSATRKNIIWTDPNGVVSERAMSFTNSGADGELYYVFTKVESKPVGQYQFQIDLAYSGWDGKTGTGTFTTRRNLS